MRNATKLFPKKKFPKKSQPQMIQLKRSDKIPNINKFKKRKII